MEPFGFTPEQSKEKFVSLHERLWGTICIATHKAMGNSLSDAIAFEQERDTTEPPTFLEFNCNYLWIKIKETFEKKAGSATIHCFEDLINLNYEGDENPLQFRQRVDALIHRFNSIDGDVVLAGQRLSEGTKLAFVIRALPKKYDITVQAVLSTQTKPTLDHLFSALQRQHENSSVRNQKSKSNKEQALSIGDDQGSRHQENKYSGSKFKGDSNKDRGGRPKDRKDNPKYRNHRSRKGSGDDSDIPSVTFPFLDDKDAARSPDYDQGISDTTTVPATQQKEESPLLMRLAESRAGHFILDSGASRHVVFDKSILCNAKEVEPFRMYGATGHQTTIKSMGAIQFTETIAINNVCYSPGATHNLLSLAVLLDNGATVTRIDKEMIQVTKTCMRKGGKAFKVNLQFHRIPGRSGVWRMKLPDSLRRSTVQSRSQFGYIEKPEPIENPKPIVKHRTVPKKNGSKAPPPPNAARGTPSASAVPAPAVSNSYLSEESESESSSDDSEPDSTLFLTELTPEEEQLVLAFHEKEVDSAKLWHNRLGHQSDSVLTHMNQAFSLGITKHQLSNLANCICDSCIMGKGRSTRIGKTVDPKHKATTILQRIHIDLVGWVSSWDGHHKNRVPTLGGNLYAIHVTDEFSSKTDTRLLKHKSDATNAAIEIIGLWESATAQKVGEAHTDGGGELINREFESYCAEKGIRLTFTTRDHPAHNGKAERRGGTLKEIARSMMAHSGVPVSLWGEAWNYATFVYNNSSQPVIDGKIPSQVMLKQSVSPNKIKVFGCDAFFQIPEEHRGAFQSRFRKGIFVGFNLRQNCYRILDVENRNRVISTRDVKFIETSFKVAKSLAGERDYDDIPEPVIPLSVIQSILPGPKPVNNEPATAPQVHLGQTAIVQHANPSNDTVTSILNKDVEIHFDNEEKDEEKTVIDTRVSSPAKPVVGLPETQLNPQVHQSINPAATSTEAKQLQKASAHWFPKSAPAVPSRRPAGQNKVTSTSKSVSAQVTEYLPSVTRSGRVSKPTSESRFHVLIDEDNNLRHTSGELLALREKQSLFTPETYKQAVSCPDSARWVQAMEEELKSHSINGTWKPEDCPRDQSPITAKWVFAIKTDENNKPIRYKARLVARGFQQHEGVDYDETFAPVTKMKSVKLLLSLAATLNLEIKQLDFDTAFLNAPLSHKVYMKLPPGSGDPGSVVRLVKSLYGLKQAGHDWNKLISGKLVKLGYSQLKCDSCLFIKRTQNNRVIVLALYVDDTSIFYHKSDEDVWLADKAAIASSYKIKDIGECQWFLNMKVTRDRKLNTITLSQSAYVERVLEKFDMKDCKPVGNPCVSYDLYSPPGSAQLDETPLTTKEQNYYQQIIGSLNYAAMITRPDIAYATNELGRFNAAAKQYHLQAAKHVLRYLRGTADLGLEFKKHPTKIPQVEIYTDASWANDLETRRSTSGLLVKFNGNVIMWATKKQRTVARSSTEAEYVAAADATSEAIWLRSWVREVLGEDVTVPLVMLCDNQSAIALAKNDTFHQRTKHIDVGHHFIREQIEWGHITIRYVPTAEQDADILTKFISLNVKFRTLRQRVISPV